jgi:hypothetical protein
MLQARQRQNETPQLVARPVQVSPETEQVGAVSSGPHT